MAEVQSFLWMECPYCHQQVRYYSDVKEWRSEMSGAFCQYVENGSLMGPGHTVHVESALASTMLLGGVRGVIQALAT